ncbi:glycosyltransferase family 4 protein [Candidatus Electronema sp. JC]|uniref:glycosyltransferase family 4 protein n=1 Tax=Candidatus Electronema sp. JC TaxID=3401570 RepID=UPI003B433D2C
MGNIHIIGCGKGTFAGAATIKCKFLSELVGKVKSVTYITDQYPPAAVRLSKKFPIEILGNGMSISSIGSLESILSELLIEKIINIAFKIGTKEKILIWASHLFPYLNAAITAKNILNLRGYNIKLLSFPVGSDIWEIGPQLNNIFRLRMLSDEIDYWATYSERFSDEISKKFPSLRKKIRVIPPVIDVNKKSYDRNFIKNDRSLVLSCHCNMRPVKRIDQTIKLAILIAQTIHRDVELFVIGPTSPREELVGNVKIVYTGLLDNPMEIVCNSDFNINTSIHDSFNYALLEAMANGVPQITTDVAGIARYIEEYNTGLTLPVELDSNLPVYKQYQHDIFNECNILNKLELFFSGLNYRVLVDNCYTCSKKIFSAELFVKRFSSIFIDEII